jgi:hypothetical protein
MVRNQVCLLLAAGALWVGGAAKKKLNIRFTGTTTDNREPRRAVFISITASKVRECLGITTIWVPARLAGMVRSRTLIFIVAIILADIVLGGIVVGERLVIGLERCNSGDPLDRGYWESFLGGFLLVQLRSGAVY